MIETFISDDNINDHLADSERTDYLYSKNIVTRRKWYFVLYAKLDTFINGIILQGFVNEFILLVEDLFSLV